MDEDQGAKNCKLARVSFPNSSVIRIFLLFVPVFWYTNNRKPWNLKEKHGEENEREWEKKELEWTWTIVEGSNKSFFFRT